MVKFYTAVTEELTPYVRASAWWNAVPQPKPSNLRGAKPQPPNQESRLAAVIRQGGVPEMPEYPPALQFLIDYLFDAGPTSPSGTGSAAVTWADLDAWQRGSGVSLQPWMCHLLRKLSSEYLLQSVRAISDDAPRPWDQVPADREQIAKRIKNVLRGS